MSSARNLQALNSIASASRNGSRDSHLPPTLRLAPTQDISQVGGLVIFIKIVLIFLGPWDF